MPVAAAFHDKGAQQAEKMILAENLNRLLFMYQTFVYLQHGSLER